jgi:hypothetical protein
VEGCVLNHHWAQGWYGTVHPLGEGPCLLRSCFAFYLNVESPVLVPHITICKESCLSNLLMLSTCDDKACKALSYMLTFRLLVICSSSDSIHTLFSCIGVQKIFSFGLLNPRKPCILAMSRPDAKKNLTTLVKAFGENRTLRNLANLVLVMVRPNPPTPPGACNRLTSSPNSVRCWAF